MNLAIVKIGFILNFAINLQSSLLFKAVRL